MATDSPTWPGKVHKEHHKEVTSTQLLIKEMLKGNDTIDVNDMYCVSTNVQTAGKGRGKHCWESPIGCAMQSILLFVDEAQVRRVPGLTQSEIGE
ncbi:hypothetical protein Pmar_PMAR017578 [Perkinsus marinus ATCC 50983]|uniref:BPL/LPL catalytic domain-containing protein n=1 Tax=Perkinsus marinus (strain ATCC 50983 / TXsc) TaxID=423536 RepID=C5LYA8_PERM5|nr:hypothetical protein Pmar_PMAR017578 [Perkinsus marinus ATCC 50983]EEQ98284.1 hypothetical protein Pmar_PMAR017578 [Perkinsus marinus ATCC 50983]|eukprot:XP_002765567.1 hypothetical protein Pmar_PMAR017578 [Perkinsus marinus ATCC 50983]